MGSGTGGLGDLEGPVLEALWEGGELSTPAVHERVGKPRGLAYTTILTILQRLHRKALAGRREEGRTHVYYAAVSREEFSRRRGEALAASLAGLGEAGIVGFLAEAERGGHEMFDLLKEKLSGTQ